jgi:integrase
VRSASRDFSSLKDPEQPIPVVPEDGLRRLLATCDGKSFKERRDTALILLLVDVGPRRAELMDLTLADVDFDPGRACRGRQGPPAARPAVRPPRSICYPRARLATRMLPWSGDGWATRAG